MNLSLLRFFRDPQGANCPPTGKALVGSGDFTPERGVLTEFTPQTEVIARSRTPDRSSLRLLFVKDDNTRALLLARGSADVATNAFSPGKIQWIQEHLRKEFRILKRDGVNVSYLAFNVRRPALKSPLVRQAIARSISRHEITRTWLREFGTVAHSFLSPLLPESAEKLLETDSKAILHEDLPLAESLLDRAGFPRGKGGIRAELRYLTTSIREGFEMGLLIRDQLARVGLKVNLVVVEPSAFFSSLRGGDFDLYSSRWIGVHDASVLYSAYFSDSPRNRIGFSDPEVDRALSDAQAELSDQRRRRLYERLQLRLAAETAYFPLWYWNNVVVVSNRLTGLEAGDSSASGAYEPLAKLRRIPPVTKEKP